MDKYDKQIAKLKKNPDLICVDWVDGVGLFKYVPSSCGIGCLTQIRKYGKESACSVTAKRILKDEGIPCSCDDIEVEHLERFAYWQRIIDKRFKKK